MEFCVCDPETGGICFGHSRGNPKLLSGRVVFALVQFYLVRYELDFFSVAQDHFTKCREDPVGRC